MTLNIITHNSKNYDYDLIVIGGGSGGLAAAKEAAKLGAKTVLFDYVWPSTQNHTWGLGGTCVNVGCVPKKLFHKAAQIGISSKQEFSAYGWKFADEKAKIEFDWNSLVETVRNYIKSLNFSYRVSLQKHNVEYINALASFVDEHTIMYNKNNKNVQITSKNFLIATGGRPYVPEDIKGAKEYAITSDDLFMLEKNPGKTLVVGASYIGLECGGFLKEFNCDVTICVRTIVLRGFDRQCSDKIRELMENSGIKFKDKIIPTAIEKIDDNNYLVSFSDDTTETYNTVMYATGRRSNIDKINIKGIGVKVSTNEPIKIKTNKYDETNIKGIYAIGDVAENRPELTPVAIKSGILLAKRLFGSSTEIMEYDTVPTTVFTLFEYGSVGLTEEGAIKKYGKSNIEVYLQEFNSLEISAAHWTKDKSIRKNEYDTSFPYSNLSKLIVHKESNLVVGFHCIGPIAGETTQGYALALKKGVTKTDFDETICIHPTQAESFHTLSITKSSKEDYKSSEGCGGGKCG